MSQYFLHFSRKHIHCAQFARYVSVGGVMLILNLLLVWFFVVYGNMNYLLASGIAFVIESVAAFFANRRWTFKTDIHFRKGYIRFLTIAFYSFLAVLIITY
jgi:putative flippase GtrA